MKQNESGQSSVLDEEACGQYGFYEDTLLWLIARGILTRNMRVLVLCGGLADKEVWSKLGFSQTTISNLDTRVQSGEFAPFDWSYQDAENLSFAKDEFDFCVVHNGLHHCYSPHRALLEMHRVGRAGLLVFEPRDSFVTRVGTRLNFGQEFEVAAVAGNGMTAGGVGNTCVPNYVYRWREREIEQAIQSYAPWGRHQFIYRYALRVPWGRLRMLKNPLPYRFFRAGLPLLRLFFAVFPRQSNGFAFAVLKPKVPEGLHPWLKLEGAEVTINKDWVGAHYHVP